ncbi:MAG: EAL domain-containing protein, partial [Holdemania filiformis]
WKADSDVGEMIRLLENTGEILPVGRWIVREVFAQARVWQQKSPDFITGFNVSYLQFKDSGFSDFLIAEAKRLKINPRQIAIELTESCQVEDFDGLAREFARLRAFGFNLSLDDFGIAYSTLLLIRNLPADSVKIDQSFIRDLTEQNQVDLAIIESVVSLCRKLNIRLVAEGVENARILKLLEAYPITLYQGFHFAKPMPASQLEPLIGSILP